MSIASACHITAELSWDALSMWDVLYLDPCLLSLFNGTGTSHLCSQVSNKKLTCLDLRHRLKRFHPLARMLWVNRKFETNLDPTLSRWNTSSLQGLIIDQNFQALLKARISVRRYTCSANDDHTTFLNACVIMRKLNNWGRPYFAGSSAYICLLVELHRHESLNHRSPYYSQSVLNAEANPDSSIATHWLTVAYFSFQPNPADPHTCRYCILNY
jgi:hypothetical protein